MMNFINLKKLKIIKKKNFFESLFFKKKSFLINFFLIPNNIYLLLNKD